MKKLRKDNRIEIRIPTLYKDVLSSYCKDHNISVADFIVQRCIMENPYLDVESIKLGLTPIFGSGSIEK